MLDLNIALDELELIDDNGLAILDSMDARVPKEESRAIKREMVRIVTALDSGSVEYEEALERVTELLEDTII